MQEKYLPIGSVVLLKGGKKELMITGYLMETKEEPGRIFDYCGCMYPQGVLRSDITCVFDHSQIQEIFSLGYVGQNTKQFLDSIKKEADKIKEEII